MIESDVFVGFVKCGVKASLGDREERVAFRIRLSMLPNLQRGSYR